MGLVTRSLWLTSARIGSKPHCVRIYSGTNPIRGPPSITLHVHGIHPGGHVTWSGSHHEFMEQQG